MILVGDAVTGNCGIGILARVDQFVHRVVHSDGLVAVGGAADGIAGDADLHIVLTAMGQGLGDLRTDIVGAAFHSRSAHSRLQNSVGVLLQIVHRNGVASQRQVGVGVHLGGGAGNGGGRCLIPAAGLVAVIGLLAHSGCGQSRAAGDIPLAVLHQGHADGLVSLGVVVPAAVDHLEGDQSLVHIGDTVAAGLTADDVRAKGRGKGIDLAAAGAQNGRIDLLGGSIEADIASAAVPVIKRVAAERGGSRAGNLVTGDILGTLLLAHGEGDDLHRGRNGTLGSIVGNVADQHLLGIGDTVAAGLAVVVLIPVIRIEVGNVGDDGAAGHIRMELEGLLVSQLGTRSAPEAFQISPVVEGVAAVGGDG